MAWTPLQNGADQSRENRDVDIFTLFRALASLAVVLGLVGLVAYAGRRWGPAGLLQTKPVAERRMAVVESLTLGAQQRLLIVRVDAEERLILLGGGQLLHSGRRGAPPVQG